MISGEKGVTWTVTIVSLHNRRVEERGWQNICGGQTWQCHNLCVLSWSPLNITMFWSFAKRSVQRKVKFGGFFFSNKINVTRSWPFSFLCRPVALVSSLMSHERTHVPLNKTELVRNTRCLPAINLIKKRDFKDFCEKATARGGGGYSHTLPTRVCAAQRGRDFEAPGLERGIHFRRGF